MKRGGGGKEILFAFPSLPLLRSSYKNFCSGKIEEGGGKGAESPPFIIPVSRRRRGEEKKKTTRKDPSRWKFKRQKHGFCEVYKPGRRTFCAARGEKKVGFTGRGEGKQGKEGISLPAPPGLKERIEAAKKGKGGGKRGAATVPGIREETRLTFL